LNKLYKVFVLLQFDAGSLFKISDTHIVGKLLAFIILLKKLLIFLKKKFEVSQ
jgi:hypothetical protein